MRATLITIKIIPIVLMLSILIGIICTMSGFPVYDRLYPIVGHSLILDGVLLLLSFSMRFCWWHKALLIGLMMIISVEWYDVNIGLISSELWYCRLILALSILSLVTSTILYYYGVFKKPSSLRH